MSYRPGTDKINLFIREVSWEKFSDEYIKILEQGEPISIN